MEQFPHIKQPTDSLVVNYKECVKFANDQLGIIWFPDEIKVEKDIQDILVNMTEQERHGVITTLKLFSHYELRVGKDYWGSRFVKIFPRPEFRRMASVFTMFELAIHKPFYNKINEVLHLDTDEFYTSYVDDPVLKSRMDFIEDVVKSDDDLASIAGFSLIEGSVLYSNFGFLKHFQANGKNKLLNAVRGINFSVRDEAIHAIAGAWSFKNLKEQLVLTDYESNILKELIFELAHKIYEHEVQIIHKIFEKGEIKEITSKQLIHFVESRINECLHNLGYEKMFEVKYNPIKDWFYDSINSYSFNDFFTGIGNQYNRNWDETGFVW